VPSRSVILLMYKLHSMIFTMHWSHETILKGTFVCSNFPTLGGSFRHREAVFDPLPRESKTTSTKINVRQFSTPYFFLDVSSRFQYYLWLVDSADSQNMIDCNKPVRHREAVFNPLAIFFELHPIYCSCWSQTSTLYYVLVSINVIMLLIISRNINISFYGTSAW
jgi:hypothetical protein